MTWLAGSQNNLESIFTIADSFYILNDILINDNKAILTNDLPSESSHVVQFNVNDRQTTI